MSASKRRLLTIAHSYCVGLNRRLADELGRSGEWDVTAVGPAHFRGDFGWHTLRPDAGEHCTTVAVPVWFAGRVHLMWYGRQLAALLREPWDLVHCWEEPYVAAAAQVAANMRPDVPLVFATFQNIAKRYPPPFSWFERYSLRRASGIVAFGHTVLEAVAPRISPGTRQIVIPPGVDTTRFSPNRTARDEVRAGLGWPDDVPVIGFLGRLIPAKGLELLMKALDGIARPWRALIVGAGPLESTLRDWAVKYGPRVAIETRVGHDDVPRWLNAMDMLCAPSQSTPMWREQFGRMLIEAFACGVPVIASDSGEIPYVVADAAIIVPENDLQGWRRAIERLLGDAELRTALAHRGRQRAVTCYDWPVVARQHTNFFKQVMADSLSAPERAA
jgi:glycosyltransferase involved in cell wall biosynthesis